MRHKMTKAFKNANGGLFSKIEKADTGSIFDKLSKSGVTMMAWADPFLPDKIHPDFVLESIHNAVDEDISVHYTAPIGNNILKEELAKLIEKKNNWKVDPERNILITPGSDSGLFYSLLPFIEPDDEVIIPSPSYPNNYLVVESIHGKVVPYLLKEENNYQIEKQNLENLITSKTKIILLTHPNNPTTTLYNKESLDIIREVVIKHDLILIVDQAFEDYTFGAELISPMSLPGLFERTISVFSISKGLGLSGFRIAYLVAPDTIMDSLYANAVAVIGATNTVFQNASIRIIKNLEFMYEFEKVFDKRRNIAYKIINEIPNVSMKLPESGFLAWVDVSKIGDSSEIVDFLVKDAKVMVNDGKNYGPGGEGHLRIVLGVYKNDETIIDALNRIKQSLIKYQQKEKK